MSPSSLIRLGWYFVRRTLARLFLSQRGLLRFRAQYEPEGLFALEPDEKKAVAALSRCIACGACDAHFTAYDQIARTTLRAPSDLVLAQARSLPDWDALVAPLAQLERGDLTRLEKVCPARVPFVEIARIARKRAEALRETRAAAPALRKSSVKHDPG